MLNLSLIMTATLAGVAGGSHCVGMCGGIATLLGRPSGRVIPIQPVAGAAQATETPASWWHVALLHLGRLLTYAFAGAVVGGLGAAGLLLKPVMPVQSILFFIGNLTLILLGLRCLGVRFSRIGQWISLPRLPGVPSAARLPQSPLLRGLMWGCLPCGLVYGVLPIALISGSVFGGALMMFCFGLGTLPYLLLTHGLANRFGKARAPAWLMWGAALILIGLGVLGLLMPGEHHASGWWC